MSVSFLFVVLIIVLQSESGLMKKSWNSFPNEVYVGGESSLGLINNQPYFPLAKFPLSPKKLQRRETEPHPILRIGVLAPDTPDFQYSLKKVLPPITMAVKSERISRILPEWKIEVLYRDTKCSSTLGPLEALAFYTNKTAGLS